MATMKISGDIFAFDIDEDEIIEDMHEALYEGAGILADAVREEIGKIPVNDQPWKGESGRTTRISTLTSAQKEGLLNGLGVAKHREEDGSVNTRIGFSGYNSHATKAHPNGEPNALVARAVESGTSFRAKTPIVRPAVRRVRQAAIDAMAKKFEEKQKGRMQK